LIGLDTQSETRQSQVAGTFIMLCSWSMKWWNYRTNSRYSSI